MATSKHITRKLQERFGDPIGSYAGDTPVGVRSVQETQEGLVCDCCGMMPVDGQCGCEESDVMALEKSGKTASVYEAVEPCDECGMMPLENEGCGCSRTEGDTLEEFDVEEGAPAGRSAW
jgi:hypothetical protein